VRNDSRRKGAVTEFEEFYAGSRVQLFRVLVTFTTDPQDAEDVLQEAYAKAAADWERVSRLDNPGAWVRRVALNRALDLHKRSRRRRRAYERLTPADTATADRVSLDVQEALRTLRPDERQVVVLHHLLGMSVAEISAETGRPSGTVKAQLVRGRHRLANELRLSHEDAR
jgi:RNA polymerase sigma factor (sigma-70 family)